MKNTTINIIENRREVDKSGIYRPDVIKAHTNATLLAIAEGEVARLKGDRLRNQESIDLLYEKTDREREINLRNENLISGFQIAINDQIVHWREIISFLNK